MVMTARPQRRRRPSPDAPWKMRASAARSRRSRWSMTCRRTLSTWRRGDLSEVREPGSVSTASITRRSSTDGWRSTRPARTSPSSRRVRPLGESCSRAARSHIRIACSSASDRYTEHLVVAERQAVLGEIRLERPSGRRPSRCRRATPPSRRRRAKQSSRPRVISISTRHAIVAMVSIGDIVVLASICERTLP